jgi:hypothetical protein
LPSAKSLRAGLVFSKEDLRRARLSPLLGKRFELSFFNKIESLGRLGFDTIALCAITLRTETRLIEIEAWPECFSRSEKCIEGQAKARARRPKEIPP